MFSPGMQGQAIGLNRQRALLLTQAESEGVSEGAGESLLCEGFSLLFIWSQTIHQPLKGEAQVNWGHGGLWRPQMAESGAEVEPGAAGGGSGIA